MYQNQFADVPRLPPVNPRVAELPEQMGEFDVKEAGGIDGLLTMIVVLTQFVVLQMPSALTQ